MAVVAGLTLTGVPLVTARLPGVIAPVPLVNTPVRLELSPAAIFAGLATKLEMEATAGVDEPPQPARTPEPRVRAAVHAAETTSRFMIFPVFNSIGRKSLMSIIQSSRQDLPVYSGFREPSEVSFPRWLIFRNQWIT